MTTPPENVRAFIEVLAKEEPKLKVASQVEPRRAVVLIVEYPSGALTVPLTPATARQVAATLIDYADEHEAGISPVSVGYSAAFRGQRGSRLPHDA